MKTELIDEIAAILPQDRTKYHYFKDKYAVDLLSWILEDHATAEVKASRFSGLLKKPIVKQAVSLIGDGRMRGTDFEDVWAPEATPYLLTVGRWGANRHNNRGWYQTTGRDANLVLQLNFSNLHNRPYLSHVGDAHRPFEFDGHPLARWPFRTLAWSRIDLSFESDEALIEEVQTDWIRYGLSRHAALKARLCSLSGRDKKVFHYLDQVLLPYAQGWQETILSASLWFIYRELGISKVFYHTHASGCSLKRIDSRLPPRSLYETLPRAFCFKRVGVAPCFLEGVLGRKSNPLFYLLDFGKGLNQ